jgi:hypothetical protein
MKSLKKNLAKVGFITSLFIALLPSQSIKSEERINLYDQTNSAYITNDEMIAQQEAWCNAGLLAISQTYHEKGFKKAKKLASQIIDAWYGYNLLSKKKVPVAFNPTWTFGETTFRTTRRGAISYFVGSDKKYPIDPGFALGAPGKDRSQWVSCEVKNAVNFAAGNVGFTMGNVTVEAKNGYIGTVDKTWVFVKNPENGQIKCVLHESATPFNPKRIKLKRWHKI